MNARHLVVHVAHDRRRGVADRHHGDARAQVDERVAVGVDDDASAGRLDEHRERRADPVGHRGLLAGEQRGGPRSGDVGDEAAFLGQGRATHEGLGHASNLGPINQTVRVEIDWIHRPDTLNLCFNALDRHVVHGRADVVALAGERPMTYARLLEEVAAFGGVLRAFGVGLGDEVRTGLTGRDGLVVLLATLRLGAVLVLDDTSAVALPGGAVVRRDASGDELDWDVLLRAGRTDPAPCAEVPVGAPALVIEGCTLTAGDLPAGGTGWPHDALATLFAGGTHQSGQVPPVRS